MNTTGQLPNDIFALVGAFGVTLPPLQIPQSFAVEMGYAGILRFVITGVANDERTPMVVVPCAIGATVFVQHGARVVASRRSRTRAADSRRGASRSRVP